MLTLFSGHANPPPPPPPAYILILCYQKSKMAAVRTHWRCRILISSFPFIKTKQHFDVARQINRKKPHRFCVAILSKWRRSHAFVQLSIYNADDKPQPLLGVVSWVTGGWTRGVCINGIGVSSYRGCTRVAVGDGPPSCSTVHSRTSWYREC